MATQNDITRDAIKSRNSNQNYLDNWEAIFGDKELKTEPKPNNNKEATDG
jgi:hypothetical protein